MLHFAFLLLQFIVAWALPAALITIAIWRLSPRNLLALWRGTLVFGLASCATWWFFVDWRVMVCVVPAWVWFIFWTRKQCTILLRTHIQQTMPEIQTTLFREMLKGRMDPEAAARAVGGYFDAGE